MNTLERFRVSLKKDIILFRISKFNLVRLHFSDISRLLVVAHLLKRGDIIEWFIENYSEFEVVEIEGLFFDTVVLNDEYIPSYLSKVCLKATFDDVKPEYLDEMMDLVENFDHWASISHESPSSTVNFVYKRALENSMNPFFPFSLVPMFPLLRGFPDEIDLLSNLLAFLPIESFPNDICRCGSKFEVKKELGGFAFDLICESCSNVVVSRESLKKYKFFSVPVKDFGDMLSESFDEEIAETLVPMVKICDEFFGEYFEKKHIDLEKYRTELLSCSGAIFKILVESCPDGPLKEFAANITGRATTTLIELDPSELS